MEQYLSKNNVSVMQDERILEILFAMRIELIWSAAIPSHPNNKLRRIEKNF